MTEHAEAAAAYHEVLLALAGETSDDAFFALLAKKAVQLSAAESAAVALLREGEPSELEFVGASGENAAELRGTRVRTSDSRAGEVARTGQLYLCSRPPLVILPLFVEQRGAGALVAFGAPDGSAFSSEALLSLQTLAAAASARAGAVRLRRSADNGLRLAAACEVAARTEDLDTLMDLARELLDADAVALYLADDEGSLHLAADAGLPEPLRAVGPEEADWERNGLRIAIGLPLPGAGRSPGALFALTHNLQVDATRPAVAAVLAQQAARLVEAGRLREEAARRADEATALYELSQAVSATLKLPEVLHRVVDAACAQLALEKCALFLKEPGSERLRLAAGRGLGEDAATRLRPVVGEGLPGWVVQFQTPTASEDLVGDRRNSSYPLESEGVSLVAAPLQVGGSTIGVLCGLTGRTRHFTVAEVELAYTIANHSAIAIENARVYAETRRQAVALRRYLQGVAHAVASPKAAQLVPDVVASLTREALGADRAALYLTSTDDSGFIQVRQVAAVGHRASESWLCSDGVDCPAAWVARKGRALAAPSVERDTRFGSKWERPRSGGYAAVPLKTDEGVLGVLEVVRRSPSEGTSDLRQLTALARHAALALEGALLRRRR
jgi:GAF domain-containing protein